MSMPAGAVAAMLATLALGAAAGALAQALRVPLPWTIGPLLATAIATVAGAPTAASAGLRHAGQWLIGTALGLTFTPQVLGAVLRLAPAIAVGVVWALAMGYAFYRWLLWANRGTGLAPASAFFGAAIGGASEMAVMAERHQGQVDRVAGAHSLRVLVIVVLVPVGLQALGVQGADVAAPAATQVHLPGLAALLAATAAGGWLFHRLRLSNPSVLGALAVAAALSASGMQWSALPPGLTALAQLLVALTLGVRFTPVAVRSAPRWLGTVALGTLAMIGASAGFAGLLSLWVGHHPATLLLATTPGGIAEMAITAAVLGLGVPVVTAFHVLRYVAVSLATAPLWQWEARRLARRTAPARALSARRGPRP